MCSLLRWIQEVVLPVVVDHVVVEHKGRGAAVTGGGRQVGWLLLLLMAILFFGVILFCLFGIATFFIRGVTQWCLFVIT
jgi:hypothetical protein